VAPRAQPAEAAPVLTGGPLCEGSGSGGAVLEPVPVPASGHCREVTWLSAAGATDIPSGMVAPAAETPPSAAPSAVVVPRLAQRDARAAPVPGATTPAALAVTRRKPNADSRQLTCACPSAPSMP
jgi:hypothetical protein